MDLVSGVSDEDPFAALRLLQICGVNRFGHVLSVVPPEVVFDFCEQRDAAIDATLGTIQGIKVDPTVSTHTLPVVAGGAALISLRDPAPTSYLGAFFRVAGPFLSRLALMGGTAIARATTLLVDPEAVSNTYA